MLRASLYTLGCRLNQAETAIMANSLKQRGFEIVDAEQAADLTVINTCTVTEQADSKCRQAVRQSIRKNPQTFIAVVGCYAQMAVGTIRQIKGVDLIVGNEYKMHLADFVDDLKKRNQPAVIHTPRISRDEFIIDTLGLYDTQTRANLKIQDGCSFVCSFCIIAKARGPARSRKFDDIQDEAKKLIEMGFKEIVLTGVNIGTYSQDSRNFLDLLNALQKLNGLERLRISSIEPTTLNRQIIDFMADSDKICRHLHIPIQSGDDKILESMRRKHNSAFYSEIIEYAAKKIPDLGLGTDVMIGYPGEGAQEFVNTKKLLADLPVSYFHVFTYSDRKGTASYHLKPKVDPRLKKERNRIMIEMGKRKKTAFLYKFIGKTRKILFEEQNNGYWEGFSDNYMRVIAPSKADLKNQLREVKLVRVEGQKIFGELM